MDTAGPIICAAITMYSPLAHFTGSCSRFRTATHWTRRVPSSVPPYHVLTFAPSTGFWLRYRTATHWTRLVPSSVPPSPCTHPLPTSRLRVKIPNSYGTQWTRRVPSSVPPSPCTHPLLTLQIPGQDTGQLLTGCGGSNLLCPHTMYSPLPPLQVSG
jgi:hypothetical protein